MRRRRRAPGAPSRQSFFRIDAVVAGRVAFVVISLVAGLARGAPLPAPEDDPKSLAQKYQQARQTVVEAEAEKRRILGSLYSINQRMKKIGVEKSQLTDQLFQVQDNVQTIAKVIVGLEAQIDLQRTQLKRRLRALYKLSGEGFLGVVFSQRTTPEIDETLRNLKIVTDNDYRLIRSYQENIATYLAQRKRMRRQVEKLIAIEKRIKKQESLLSVEHRAKSQIVAELDNDRSLNLSQMKKIRSKTRDLRQDSQLGTSSVGSEFEELLKPSIFEQKGHLPPPISGRVVQGFGLIADERYKIQLSHKGWRFEAPKGTAVSAIYDGSVLFADRLPGYGSTVVIDHGDHYYSVYSHIARIKIKTGDSLKKGQPFAEAGGATRRYGEGIYFEIRHFSEPEDPVKWIGESGMPLVAPDGRKGVEVARDGGSK